MKALVLGSQPIVFILLGCGRKTNMATFPEKRKAIVFRNIDYFEVLMLGGRVENDHFYLISLFLALV